jgi:cold shock CspA family protein
MATSTATDESNMTVTSGRVKWFNNKAGYGFISVSDCETAEERDIFVHHSEIRVEQTQYRYLVQGEYVEFVMGPISRENKIDVHATNVRGINGGKLMCETRNEVRTYRATSQALPTTYATPIRQPSRQREASRPPQQSELPARPPRQASSSESKRPQLDKADQTEWMIVPRRRAETVPPQSRQKNQPRQRQPAIEIAQ